MSTTLYIVRCKSANTMCQKYVGLWASEYEGGYCGPSWRWVDKCDATLYTSENCDGFLKKMKERFVDFEFEIYSLTSTLVSTHKSKE